MPSHATHLTELAGKLLIAMPGMADERFAHSVVLICAHGPDSTMGFIINKPSREMGFAGLLGHLGIAPAPQAREIRVHFGGPVEQGRGFVLHRSDWQIDTPGVILVPGGYRVSSTLDILEALAAGEGPDQALLALGYAGWGAGQLEAEIRRNDWLVAEVPEALVFDAEDRQKWALALKGMGVDPVMLAPSAGRA